ncbi:MAG: multicopper oxidase domain-containing protein, partial [Stackebrandtia sp.]
YRTGTDRRRDPVNPPAVPGDLEDHGAMSMNYRCEPLRERRGDPADWFSSAVHGDPQTPILRAYPGEPLRIRMYQGSHEEQHSFRVHGMRWNTWSTDPDSPPRDQQTVGISEAFTMRVDDPHGPGDYLWGLGTSDDLWMGAWGLFRVHAELQDDLPALPSAFKAKALPGFDAARARRYRVTARGEEIVYSDQRSDPLAARYTVEGLEDGQPLVLRCRQGEWVEIVLTNELRKPLEASPFDPRLSALDEPGDREVSHRVSMHPSGILRYDVRDSDGSNVGRNADGTAAPSDASGSRWNLEFNPDGTIRDTASVVYRWYADTPGVVLLEDRADVVTHKHRGLIGALVVEAADATPHDPVTGAEKWVGEQAVVREGDSRVRELVLLLQDGLRLYHDGDHTQPVSDLEPEPADTGQKGFNYRSAHLRPRRPTLATADPGTPLLECEPGDTVRVHLAMATDRARNHTFQIHGQTWPMEQHIERPRVGAIGALSVGSLRTVTFKAGSPGDYAYRAGVLRWHLSEGIWGLIRVRD